MAAPKRSSSKRRGGNSNTTKATTTRESQSRRTLTDRSNIQKAGVSKSKRKERDMDDEVKKDRRRRVEKEPALSSYEDNEESAKAPRQLAKKTAPAKHAEALLQRAKKSASSKRSYENDRVDDTVEESPVKKSCVRATTATEKPKGRPSRRAARNVSKSYKDEDGSDEDNSSESDYKETAKKKTSKRKQKQESREKTSKTRNSNYEDDDDSDGTASTAGLTEADEIDSPKAGGFTTSSSSAFLHVEGGGDWRTACAIDY